MSLKSMVMKMKVKVKKTNKVRDGAEITTEAQKKDQPLEYPTLIDNMLNEGVSFNKDHFLIPTGLGSIKFGRSIYVKRGGFPRSVRIGWLEGLFNANDVDASVHVDPIERNLAIKLLQDKIDQLNVVMYAAEERKDQAKFDDCFQKREDSKLIQRQIKNNTNGLYYVSVQGTVYADTLDELNAKCVELENLLGGESIELLSAYNNQANGFKSCLPLGKNYLVNTDRNLDQLSLTAMFPHNSSKLNHTGGFPIGRYGSEFVYYNNFDNTLTNYSVGIFGESGIGKSVLVKQMIARGFMDGIEKVVILDCEPEYVELTKALGGVVVPLYPVGEEVEHTIINPHDIFPEKEVKLKGTPQEYYVEKIKINDKVKELIEFYKIMKQSVNGADAMLNAIEISALNEILNNAYRSRNITEDPESIYEQTQYVDENGLLTYSTKYISMPTISEVLGKLEEKREKGFEELKELIAIVRLFKKGSAFGMFDGETKIVSDGGIDSLEQAPVVTFDISRLSSTGIERPLAMHVVTTWVWNRFIVSNPKAKKRVMIDEAWQMIPHKSMMEWLKTLSLRGRKWNTSLTLVSQRYEMFDRDETARDVVSQFSTTIFLKQAEQDIDPIVNTFKLSPAVGNMLLSFSKGDVLMKANQQIVQFKSEPTPEEWKYLNTNQNLTMNSEEGVA